MMTKPVLHGDNGATLKATTVLATGVRKHSVSKAGLGRVGAGRPACPATEGWGAMLSLQA